MSLTNLNNSSFETLASAAGDLLQRLFPICRSITGDGVRQSLRIIQDYADFKIVEYPTGTQCFDWTIPDEWNIRDAWIKDATGKKIVSFNENNLHVVSYSEPIERTMSFSELEPHLHSLPNLPDAIPYRTSYYKRNWGFCLTHKQRAALDSQSQYHVCIDSSLAPGALTLAESVIGEGEKEFLISSYCCHPSMANDNLSGPIVTTLLRSILGQRRLKNRYRFVILPETIGAIAYLAHNKGVMQNCSGGFVITTCGGPGPYGYKATFRGDHLIDRIVRQTFREHGLTYVEYPFVPDGSDERQYSSPGFRIPVGSITKDKYYEYDYYHTSLDNLEFVQPQNLIKTLQLYLACIEKLEGDSTYISLNPNCEVQLGKRGLYPQTGGALNQRVAGIDAESAPNGLSASALAVQRVSQVDAISWLLFLADGNHSMLDMAERSGVSFEQLKEVAQLLQDGGLLSEKN